MNGESGAEDKKEVARKGANESVLRPKDAPSISHIPSENADIESDDQSKWQRRHYRVQIALAFIGIGVAIIYGWQLVEMRQATSIAAENYALQTRAFHIDQRAWMGPSQVTGKAEVGKRFTISVSMKNTGKTFAKDCRGMISYRIKQLSDADPEFEQVLRDDASGLEVASIIPPNAAIGMIAELKIEGVRILTERELDFINNPTNVILVFGKLTYKDVFGCDHWTTFCQRIDGDSPPYVPYGRYNNADDNQCP